MVYGKPDPSIVSITPPALFKLLFGVTDVAMRGTSIAVTSELALIIPSAAMT